MAGGDFRDRLLAALGEVGMSQADLARKLGISQAAVAQWMTGGRPSPARTTELSKLLNVTEAWLLDGTGAGPIDDPAAERAEYLGTTGWGFRPTPVDGQRDFGNANLWALPWGLGTLVREAGQNVIDAIIAGGVSAEIVFSLIRLKGDDLTRFLDALGWEGRPGDVGLEAHLSAAAKSGQRLGSVLRSGLEDFRQSRELLLLRIEDAGTTGLAGPEIGQGNFAALCRNNLDSNKADTGGSGGSYGLGKAVFWRASRFATVLFGSTLAEPQVDELTGTTVQAKRIIGRADLPWHEPETGNSFAGPGWFGRISDKQGARNATSVWGNGALAEDLFLDRSAIGGGSGTSVLVVGFQDPSSDTSSNPQEITKQLAEEAARWFWPAIESGRLKVGVRFYEGHTVSSTVEVDPTIYEELRPFVEMLRAFRSGDADASDGPLPESGSVALRRVPLQIPRRKAPPAAAPAEHEAVLLVRREPEEAHDGLLSHVAYFRGREMVIMYDQLVLPGAMPYRAVVMTGNAAGSTEEDRAAERFLRTAEPPAHDDWKITPDLKADYAQGGGQAIRRMFDAARDTIRGLVRAMPEPSASGPQGLRELLRVGTTPDPVGPRPTVRVLGHALDGNNAWNIEGEVHVPPGGAAWRVTPTLMFAADSGGGRAAVWSLTAAAPGSVEGSELLVPAGRRSVRFTGVSDPAQHPVAATECAVTVELRNTMKLKTGAAR